MRSCWKIAAVAAAIYGFQSRADSRALLGSSWSLAGRDGSSATTLNLPSDDSALSNRDFGDLEKGAVLLGRAPRRSGGGKSYGSIRDDEAGDLEPSSGPRDPESAPPRISDDDGSDPSTTGESNGPARIASDESSDYPATPPSGMAALEECNNTTQGIAEYAGDGFDFSGCDGGMA